MPKWLYKLNLFMAGFALGMVLFSLAIDQPGTALISGMCCIANLCWGITGGNDE